MARACGYMGGRLAALLGLICAAPACQAPPSEEMCELAPERLALDPVYVTLGLQETIRLDDELVDVVATVLARARAVEPHLLRIHTLPPWWPDRLYVWAQRTEVANAWGRGELMTGVAALDFLLAEYFATRVERSGDRPDEFVLYFAEPLNSARLLERVSAIEGMSGSVLWMVGDSDTIEAVRDDDSWRVTFTLGWGDCVAGCIYHHRWEVSVPGHGGDAVLVREGGESADWFMDCVPVAPAVSGLGVSPLDPR